MKILITGSEGQLGQALIKNNFANHEIIKATKKDFDFLNPKNFINNLRKYKPDWVINCAAFTMVDDAETNKDHAFLINSKGTRLLADAVKDIGGKMIHISTDFIFDGHQSFPYKPYNKPNPISVYGSSKLAGENAVKEILFRTHQAIILRTSWLMGPTGNNFALTMLKLHETKNEIRVVCDQIGSPTSTLTLSSACWSLICNWEKQIKDDNKIPQILHWSDAGVASWFDIAIEVGEIGLKLGLLSKKAKVIPIPSEQYQTIARRPSYSVLDSQLICKSINIKQIHWRKSLYELLKVRSKYLKKLIP